MINSTPFLLPRVTVPLRELPIYLATRFVKATPLDTTILPVPPEDC